MKVSSVSDLKFKVGDIFYVDNKHNIEDRDYYLIVEIHTNPSVERITISCFCFTTKTIYKRGYSREKISQCWIKFAT